MASLAWSDRSKAVTGSALPWCIWASTWPTLSSGMVKTTVIGWSCVITTSGVVLFACTTLPGSTSRKPTRPVIGAVMLQNETCTWSYCNRALIDLHRTFVLQNNFFLVVQLLLGDGIARPGIAIALHVHLGLRQQTRIPLERSLCLQQLGAIWARVDLNQRLAAMHDLSFPVVHCGQISPVTWLVMVSVWTGVTVPMACRYTPIRLGAQ